MVEFGLGLCLVLGTLFIVSAVTKASLVKFQRVVEDYELLPAPAVRPVAVALPLVEAFTGITALLGIVTWLALPLAAALLVGFAVAMSLNLLRGHRNACGCQGSDKPVSWVLVARNLGLASAAVAVAATHTAGGATILLSRHPAMPTSSIVAIVVILIVGYVGWEVISISTTIWRLVRGSSIPQMTGS